MKKFIIMVMVVFMAIAMLASCGDDSKDETKQVEEKPEYEVVEEGEALEGVNTMRVITDLTSESDLESIVKDVQKNSKEFNAVHLYIHEPPNEHSITKYHGRLKASARIAHTQRGAAQTGVGEAGTYTFEMKEDYVPAPKDEQSEEEKI